MALQTSHRSEASSTPTPTSSSGADPNAQHDSFSPAGSPPLILAFLAIGLFAAAMIVVFGWRRVQFGRAWTLGGIPTIDHPIPLPKILPNKPKLWDIWCGGDASWTENVGSRKSGRNKRLHWENITPFTANAVPLYDVSEGSIIPDTPPMRSDALRPPPSLFQLRWSTRQTPPPQPPRRHRESMKSIESSPSTTSTLQVGVIIIMPSARDPIYVRTDRNIGHHEQEKHRERKEMVDYSIGIYECAWDQ
ncbi:hypothetical protein CVT25_008580 [Psilocybe cyanescens]|uniref:Uncharacterized protein n=1 Tax=Psilocybe cyanescens TaxID=93625 RepID=A0A409XNB3_PSICY|nr:hypothetical protein CVT25_008580 [Psilocybe cyanescens]